MVEVTLSRRGLLTAGVALSAAGPAAARSGPGPDHMGRMIMPVTVNGVGPFRFALDSAASLSLIASDLVEPLALTPAGAIGMHTLLAREEASTVLADQMATGVMDERRVRLAVGSRAALGGLDGLISPVLLGRRRVTLNFRGERISVGRARARGQSMFSPERRIHFTSPADPAFGSLVVINVAVAGRRVSGVVDTGAQSTIVNERLVDAVGLRGLAMADGSRTQPVLSATGQSAPARMIVLPGLSVGPLSFSRVPVLAGNFHAFDVWGLGDSPAMLLGMDVLRGLRSMVIDYGSRDVIVEV